MILKKNILTLVSAILFSVIPIFSGAAESAGTVLITGANRGIGLALAKRFGEAGYTVIGTARSPEKAVDLKATGARVEKLDVTSQDSVDALARSLGDTPLDILINNAGIKGHDAKQLDELEVDQLAQTLSVNTLGPLRVIQALYTNIQRSPTAIVANISSMMGSMEMNTWGCCLGYRASKSALNSFTKTLAVDHGDKNLIFVTLHPGYVQTDMNDGQGNVTPAQSADGLFKVITGLDDSDNGKFYDFKGNELPW
jgi:NAD(P)-dependent dehydrogenase (short-subunit alcohol dehydrogenase family)